MNIKLKASEYERLAISCDRNVREKQEKVVVTLESHKCRK